MCKRSRGTSPADDVVNILPADSSLHGEEIDNALAQVADILASIKASKEAEAFHS